MGGKHLLGGCVWVELGQSGLVCHALHLPATVCQWQPFVNPAENCRDCEALQLDVLTPEFTISHIAKAMPVRVDAIRKQLETDLRLAGVPE
jgi:hypothetical protein